MSSVAYEWNGPFLSWTPCTSSLVIWSVHNLLKQNFNCYRLHPCVSSVAFICTNHPWIKSTDEKVIYHVFHGWPFYLWTRFFHPWMILTDENFIHGEKFFRPGWDLYFSCFRWKWQKSITQSSIYTKSFILKSFYQWMRFSSVKIIHGWKYIIRGTVSNFAFFLEIDTCQGSNLQHFTM